MTDSLLLPPMINLLAVWWGIAAGMASGAVIGLFFHDGRFLGGYDGWPRRLIRLGHISFFGLALVNLAFVQTVSLLPPTTTAAAGPGPLWLAAAWLLVAGAVLMPTVCFLAAWRPVMRSLFALPVGSLMAGVACVLIQLGV